MLLRMLTSGAKAASGVSSRAIDQLVQSKGVTIFSKTTCPYCSKAKQLFSELNVPARVVELDQVPEGAQLLEKLYLRTGQRTVPFVFVNGRHIGGYDKTAKAHESGELRRLLEL